MDTLPSMIIGGCLVYWVGWVIASGIYYNRKNTTRARDRRDARRWPLVVIPWLIPRLAKTLLWLTIMLVVAPTLPLAWAMVAFDPDSAYRARQRRPWQLAHAERCEAAAAQYVKDAYESTVAGYPLDALAQRDAADLMARLARGFRADATPPDDDDEPPRVAALSSTAATRTVELSPRPHQTAS
jgi:hypothetical protein